jgi:hypothetical protein
MHDRTPLEQGAGENAVPRPNLQDMLTLYFCDIGYALDSMRVDKEMLVVVRFHRDVNT